MQHIEDEHQAALIQWAQHTRINYLNVKCAPSAKVSDYLHAIPNGGKRNVKEAKRLKAQGVCAGIPDLSLPIAASGFHGLYIEMKRPIIKGKPKPRLSDSQKEKINLLIASGYAVCVCYGWQQAREMITRYLNHDLSKEDFFK
jgi:hypothetical protein